jgi:MATE family multidrug resistance protein
MTAAPLTSPSRAELRELWKLAIPITVAQAGQALMGFVDTAVLARAGTNSLTAVALSNAILFIVGSFGAGMLMGLEPLVSQAMGAGNDRRARTLLWQGSYLALIAGTLLALPMVVLPRVLPLFGVHFAELPLVRDYLTWRAPGLPMVLLFGTARAYVQAIERPGVLVVSMVCANVLNLVADVLLVFGGADLPAFLGPLRLIPALGVKGAALTTTLCCVLQWFIVARFIRTVPVSGGPIEIRPEWPAIRQALTVGVPIGLQLIADEGIHAITSVLARGFGPESVSAHQIALTYCMLSFTVAAGIGSAGCVRVGMAVGAQDTLMTRMRAHVALSSGAAFMMCSGLLFALFPLPLARLIGAPPEVVPLLVPLLLVAALFQLSDGVLGVSVGVLRGMGDTRFPSLAIMAGHYAVGLPVGLVLAYAAGYGILGLMGGLCVGFAAMALALLWRIERLSAGVIQPLDAA